MSPGQISNLIFIVVIIGIFYVLLLRPQMQRQKQRTQLIVNIRKDDKIVTIGGIYGRIVEVKDDVVMLEVAKNVILEFAKAAIADKA